MNRKILGIFLLDVGLGYPYTFRYAYVVELADTQDLWGYAGIGRQGGFRHRCPSDIRVQIPLSPPAIIFNCNAHFFCQVGNSAYGITP